jgi:hypothetical protein
MANAKNMTVSVRSDKQSPLTPDPESRGNAAQPLWETMAKPWGDDSRVDQR